MRKYPFNAVLLYVADQGRPDWNVSDLMPYVLHDFSDDTPKSWMFDSFILMDLYFYQNEVSKALWNDKNVPRGTDINYHFATKDDWQGLINRYLSVAGYLNTAITTAISEAGGNPPFKHKFYVGLPEPLTTYCVNGGYIHFTNREDAPVWGHLPDSNNECEEIRFTWNGPRNEDANESCSRALIWFINTFISRLGNNCTNFPNLEFGGFYWIGENTFGWTIAFDTIIKVRQHIQYLNNNDNNDLQLLYAPYKGYYQKLWTTNGNYIPYRDQCSYTPDGETTPVHPFDVVCAQPGLFQIESCPEHREESCTIDCTDHSKHCPVAALRFMNDVVRVYGDGLVFEVDAENIRQFMPARQYISFFEKWPMMPAIYYLDEQLLIHIYSTENNCPLLQHCVLKEYIDELATLINNRRERQLLPEDVNGNGIVDIIDQNIVQNEMMSPDENVGLSDVNGDGKVDIKDYVQVSNKIGH
ncbi:MAG: DUF4855 domain-containing protein [Bacteroidales bacterium]|nr:DUF4855 domain-containing protein [Candidatus Sodaliphilus aphodohippi]